MKKMKKMRMISDPDQIKVEAPVVTLYDENGFETDDINKSLAKVEVYQGKIYHFLLRDGFRLVNTLEANYNQRNRYKWNFSLVNEDCFSSYMTFLKTKKSAAYTNAERKSHDGR